jgi:predicted metal-binding protein
MCVVFIANYFFRGRRHSRSIARRIKPIQSFKYAHRGKMHMCIHISKCSYIYKYLRCNIAEFLTVFLKKYAYVMKGPMAAKVFVPSMLVGCVVSRCRAGALRGLQIPPGPPAPFLIVCDLCRSKCESQPSSLRSPHQSPFPLA